VHRCNVDPAGVVVELERHGQALRRVRSRKLPKYSYAEVMTASASRAARSASPTDAASASGRASSASIPTIPAGESASAPALHSVQTAPPAAGE